MHIAGPALLLTGATGLVGGSLLARLRRGAPGRTIVALTRRPEAARQLAQPGVVPLVGDLAQPGCGLEPSTRRALQASVTDVVHSAADIRFSLSIEEARAANVAGTRHLLEFASGCPRLERFAHVSTAYVAGCRTGGIPEEPLPFGHDYLNAYQQSKHEAEQVALKAAQSLPVAVYRLSTLIGEADGCVRQFNYFHHILKLVPRNPLPVIPGDPDAPVDLTASNWAADALAFLFEQRFQPGSVFQLCAGADDSMTAQEVVERTFALVRGHARHGGAARRGVPRLVSLAEFDDYVASTVTGDGVRGELVRVIRQFLPHLALKQAFCSRRTRSLLQAANLSPPPIRSFYDPVVTNCLDSDWGQRQVARPAGLCASRTGA